MMASDRVVGRQVDGVSRAAYFRVPEPLGLRIERDHRVGAGAPRERRDELPYYTHPEYGHRLSGLDLGAADGVQRHVSQSAEADLLVRQLGIDVLDGPHEAVLTLVHGVHGVMRRVPADREDPVALMEVGHATPDGFDASDRRVTEGRLQVTQRQVRIGLDRSPKAPAARSPR